MECVCVYGVCEGEGDGGGGGGGGVSVGGGDGGGDRGVPTMIHSSSL